MELKEKFASESGHWYDLDGNPAYTVIGKNGSERNTTLRDARVMNLVPSVTTVLRVAAAPGLERWKQTNLLMAALTLPKIEDESLDQYAERCIADAGEQSKKAMELGTSIHGSLEKAYLGEAFNLEHKDYVSATMMKISDHFGHQDWIAEKSFSSPLGFGGKVDLHSKNVVIDFKTSAFSPDDKKKGYDEHKMQLAAYAIGLDLQPGFRAANAFVSTTHPGEVQIVEWTQDDINQGYEMFLCLLRFWQAKNNHFPKKLQKAA
jgi:CRISPR/Cas system-associated exonuclease Cas4 (RecB family)